jgi:hypothetical protein
MLVCGTYLQVKLRELDILVKREWLALPFTRPLGTIRPKTPFPTQGATHCKNAALGIGRNG